MTASALTETPAADALLVRRVRSCLPDACTDQRAAAVNALARAFLHNDLTPQARHETEIALTRALDDPEPRVRRAMAEALASARAAPRHLVLGLAADAPNVARIVLAASPVLNDADLVEAAATSDAPAQTAIARRARVTASVAAALAEVGERAAAVALAGNLGAIVSEPALWRLLERFGADEETRARLAMRPGLTAALRAAVAAATMDACTRENDRYEPRHADRLARDGREQAFVAIALDCPPEELVGLVEWLRRTERLTVGVIVRALAGGDLALLGESLAQMSGAPLKRVLALLRAPRGQGFAALWRKAAMPAPLLPAFRIAVDLAGRMGPGVGVNRPLTGAMLREIEALDDPALRSVCAKLWRLSAEGARADARESEPAASPELLVAEPETPIVTPPLRFEPEGDFTPPPFPAFLLRPKLAA